MYIQKQLPDVYGQHAMLDRALGAFRDTAGSLTISEYAESPDWRFSLVREDGRNIRAVLYACDQVDRREMVNIIRDGVARMLAA